MWFVLNFRVEKLASLWFSSFWERSACRRFSTTTSEACSASTLLLTLNEGGPQKEYNSCHHNQTKAAKREVKPAYFFYNICYWASKTNKNNFNGKKKTCFFLEIFIGIRHGHIFLCDLLSLTSELLNIYWSLSITIHGKFYIFAHTCE